MNYFNNRKKPVSEHVYAKVIVWQCSKCNCWSRTDFIQESDPICPLCHGVMNQVSKMVRVE